MKPRKISRELRCLVLVLLVVVVAFAGSAWGVRVFDDHHSVFENPSLRNWREVPRFFTDRALFSAYGGQGSYRPITLTTYAVTFALFGESEEAFHLGNLLAHLLVVSCLFWLFLRLGQRARVTRPLLTAGIGALAFGIQPAASQVVHYISSRSESLALLGTAVAAAAHLEAGRAEAAASRRWLFTALSLAGVLIALGSKETGILVALTLPLVHVASRPSIGPWKQHWASYFGLGATWTLVAMYWMAFLATKTAALLEPGRVAALTTDAGSGWFVEAIRASWVYWNIGFWPAKLAVFRELWPSDRPLAWSAGAALVLSLGLCGSLIALFRGRLRLWGLAGLLYFAPLVPYLFHRLHLVVNENRLYPVLVGWSLAAALVISWCWERCDSRGRRMALLSLLTLVACAAIGRDWRASWVWASEVRLWENAVRVSPWSGDIRAGLGVAYLREERWEEAELELLAALETSGLQRFVVLDNLGIVAYRTGRLEEALDRFRQAYRLQPGSIEVATNLGGVLLDLGRPAEATPYFRQVLSAASGYCPAQLGLLTALRDLGRLADCRLSFARVPSHCRAGDQAIGPSVCGSEKDVADSE